MSAERTIAICGGGVAGLAAAISMRLIGASAIEPVVYEKEAAQVPGQPGSEVGSVSACKINDQGIAAGSGGVLLLWANAMAALHAIDDKLYQDVIDRGRILERTEFRDWSQGRLLQLPMADFDMRYKESAVLIRRSGLMAALEERAKELGVEIRRGCRCDGYSDGAHSVTPIIMCNGRQIGVGPFDGLVGCDGIRSQIRRQVHGDTLPRSAYHTAWTGISKIGVQHWEFGPGQAVAYLGRGLRLCASTLDTVVDARGAAQHVVYWYATEPLSQWDNCKCARRHGRYAAVETNCEQEQPRHIEAADLHKLFAEVSKSAAGLLQHSIDGPYPHPVEDHRPIRRWSLARVTLAGDAAHASTPDLGQGACQALESAVGLGRALAETASVPSAFARYARRRMERTARVTDMSRLTSLQSSASGPGLDAIRNTAIRTLLPEISLRQLHWLFDVKYDGHLRQ